MLNAMARYGDHAARWALIRNYHTARDVRAVVSPEEITRYGLDILVSKLDFTEKADFEYIFVLTKIFEERKSPAFARAFINALRDDARLQDPLTLGGIAGHLQFAPGACDALGAEARKAGIQRLGGEGCDEQSREALIAFAKAKGSAGVDAKARADAVPDVRRLAEGPPAR